MPVAESVIKRPSQLVISLEEAWHWGGAEPWLWSGNNIGPKDCNACYFDGHAKVMKFPFSGSSGVTNYDANWFLQRTMVGTSTPIRPTTRSSHSELQRA